MSIPADMTPAEIDAELARLWLVEQRASDRAAMYSDYVARRLSPTQTADFEAKANAAQAEAHAAHVEARPYEAEVNLRGGWSRYFLVTNGNGHVHRGTHCSTCFPTTQYGWLTDLSDCDEAAMVAEYGEMACTVCFPNAPTFKGFGDGTSTYARKTQAEKDERATAKQARADAKAAKALVAPVKLGKWETVTTVAAAKARIRDHVASAIYYPDGNAEHLAEMSEEVGLLVEALKLKGMTGDEIADLIAKAEKKAHKEMSNR